MEHNEQLFIIQRKGGSVLLYSGYQFHKNKKFKNGSVIWACSKKHAEKCRGTVTVHDSRIIKNSEHSCVSDLSKNDIDKQLFLMKQAACNSLTPIKQVYDNHVAPLKDSGIELIRKIPPYSSIKSGLFDNRKKALEVNKLAYKSPMEVVVPPEFEQFLLADYAYGDTRIVAFCSDEARKLIPKQKSFFGDGTFHSCPRPFQQLYTIHCDFDSSMQFINIVPVIYVLMSNRKSESYEIMLKIIKSQIPGFNPTFFMTDYEAAAIRGIKTVFPQAKTKGCFFHYAKAIWRQAKKFKVTTAQSQKRIVALTTTLPYLPSSLIRDGWEYILSDMPHDDKGLAKFVRYMEHQWLKDDDFLAQWSIFGELIRTTNCLEGWHYKINEKVGRRVPNLVNLLKILKDDSIFYILKMKGGILEKRKKEVIRRDEFILKSNLMLTDGSIDVGYFLERLAWKGSLFKK